MRTVTCILLAAAVCLALGGGDALAQKGAQRGDDTKRSAAEPLQEPKTSAPEKTRPTTPTRTTPTPPGTAPAARAVPVRVPDVTGLTRAEAEKTLREAGLRPGVLGVGSHVSGQTPVARSQAVKGSAVILKLHTPDTRPVAPAPTPTAGLRGPLPAPMGLERVEDTALEIQSAGYLTLNGQVGQIELYPPAQALLAWTISGDAVSLRVGANPFSVPCEDGPSQWDDLESLYLTGSSGSQALDLASETYSLGQTYYVMGCGWLTPGIFGMPPQQTGFTNVVSFRYGPSAAGDMADILVKNLDLGTTSPGGVDGYPLQVLLRNDGAAPTGLFTLAIQYRRQSPFATAFYNETMEISMEGNSENLVSPGIYLDRGKDWQVTVTADSGGTVAEASEQNNQLSAVVPQPYPYQPHVRSVRVRHDTKPDTYLTFKIKNQGGGAADYRAQVIIDHSQTIEFPVFDHAPGEEKFFVVETSQLPTGQHDVQVIAQNFAGHYISNTVDKSYHKTTGGGGGSGAFDLKVKDVYKHQNNQPDTYVTFKVKNIAGGTSTPYRLNYGYTGVIPVSFGMGTVSTGPDAVDESPVYPPLGPGEVRQHQLQSELLVGHYELRIDVNREDGQPDTNVGNDVKYQKYKKTD